MLHASSAVLLNPGQAFPGLADSPSERSPLMKRKPRLNKKAIQSLKLKLKQVSDRKVAPAWPTSPSNGMSCTS